MLPEDYGVLNELLKELKQEAGAAKMRMDVNLRRIQESETYINALMASESEDFKVFSPRRVEVLHREEIQDAKECRLACMQENEKLAERSELLDGRIRRVEELLGCLERETWLRAKEAGELQAKTLQSLKELTERMEESSTCIERNPLQARQDFAIIGKRLRELARCMEDTVWIEKGHITASEAG